MQTTSRTLRVLPSLPRGRSRRASSRARPRVLLVDDHDELRFRFKLIPGQGLGARVVEAGTSERALELARRRRFDLVISDINHLGGMNGLEMLKLLRKERPALPVMIVSGSLNEATSYWAEQLGACCCLEKPFAAGTLVEAVARVLGFCTDHSPADGSSP